MILIVSTISEDLLYYEFVKPLEKIVSKLDDYDVVSYKENYNPLRYSSIILSGTAIKDFEYMKHIDKFNWIKNYNKTIIGICAGSQIIAKLYNMDLESKSIIGSRYINCKLSNKRVLSYFLITKVPIYNYNIIDVLCTLDDKFPVVFKIKNTNIYGFLFHPEVYNKDFLHYLLSKK